MDVIRAVISSFSVLRIRNFRIYLGGQAVSLIGTWLQVTAQGWVVWKLTGSTVDLGVTSMLSTLPMLLLGPWAGAWADRYDRRKILIASQVAAMTLAFILSFLVLTETVQLWHVFALSFALGIVTAIDMPAQQAFLGDLSGTKEVRKAVNLNVMIIQVSRILGPAFAGIIVGAFGAGIAFFLNGASFIAVIISLLIVRGAKIVGSARPNQSALGGFREALAFIQSQPRLRDLVLIAIMLTFFGFSIVLNILPAVASDVLHSDASMLGALMSSSGMGALVGVVVVAPYTQSLRRTGRAVSIALMCTGSAFILLGLSNIPILAMGALFIAGLAAPSVMTTVMGLLQFSTPPHMRARVMSLFTMVSFGFQPIAALWIGWLADKQRLGVQSAILLNATCLIVGGLAMLSRASLRQWEVARALEPAPVAAPGD